MAAMIEVMDTNIGRILDKLDNLGLTEETIIVFLGDNGGNMYDEIEGTTPTNNYPLRNGKGNIYEGGIRVPLIVKWPGVVSTATTSDDLVVSPDIYPTIIEMAGLQMPAEQTFDGQSIVPILQEKEFNRDTIFMHFPHYIPATGNKPATMVRKGKWKLIRYYYDTPEQEHRYELYNLDTDIGETNNLASEYPEKVQKLAQLIDNYLEDTGALPPLKNPKYDGS